MAGDLQYSNSVMKFKGASKIIRCPPNEMFGQKEPFLIGFAGVAGEMVQLMDFFLNCDAYGKPPRTKSTYGLILNKEGIYMFDHSPLTWMKIDSKYHAIGSGQSFALGAMATGATPKQAVKAAFNLDTATGFGVKELTLK